MNDREQRGLALAALYRIEQKDGKWIVPSQTGDGTTYVVDPEKRHCTCRDHRGPGGQVQAHVRRGVRPDPRERTSDGTETVTRTFKVTEKVTYKQDWPNYNKAQTHEKDMFLSILADLCRAIREPVVQGAGPQAGQAVRPDLLVRLQGLCHALGPAVHVRPRGRGREGVHQQGRPLQHRHQAHGRRGAHVDPQGPDRRIEPAARGDRDVVRGGFVGLLDQPLRPMVRPQVRQDDGRARVGQGAPGLRDEDERRDRRGNPGKGLRRLARNSRPCSRRPPRRSPSRNYRPTRRIPAQANMDAVAALGGTPYIAFKDNTTGAVGGLFAKMFHFYCYQQGRIPRCHRALQNQPLMGASKPATTLGGSRPHLDCIRLDLLFKGSGVDRRSFSARGVFAGPAVRPLLRCPALTRTGSNVLLWGPRSRRVVAWFWIRPTTLGAGGALAGFESGGASADTPGRSLRR